MRPALLLAALLCASPALAFEPPLHEALARSSLSEAESKESLPGLSRGDLDSFRRWFYAEAVSHLDAAGRARFQKRWPDGAAFNAFAFRELLGLSGAARLRLQGFDAPTVGPATAAEVLAAGAAAPENDQRHRDRTLGRRPEAGVAPVPVDPEVLAFGPGTGAASDVWAFSAAQVVEGPRGVAGQGQGVAFARVFFTLAGAARRWSHPGARTLALTYLGNATHYLQKLASPLWAVAPMHPILSAAAERQYRWRALLTAGGALGPLRPPGIIAESLQRNHRRFLDRRTADRFESAPLPPLSGEVTPAVDAAALATSVAAEASPEAEDLYGAAIAATCDRMRVEGFVFHDPRAAVAKPPSSVICDADSTTTIDALMKADALVDRSLARAAQATRALVAGFATAPTCDGACVAALVTERLDALDAADARRDTLIQAGVPAETTTSTAWTVGDALGALAILGAVWFWARRTPSLNIDYWARSDA